MKKMFEGFKSKLLASSSFNSGAGGGDLNHHTFGIIRQSPSVRLAIKRFREGFQGRKLPLEEASAIDYDDLMKAIR
jgi:hypothetical protein